MMGSLQQMPLYNKSKFNDKRFWIINAVIFSAGEKALEKKATVVKLSLSAFLEINSSSTYKKNVGFYKEGHNGFGLMKNCGQRKDTFKLLKSLLLL